MAGEEQELKISTAELSALSHAAEALTAKNVEPYFQLKALFQEGDTTNFRKKFNRYYGMGRFQSQEWIDAYYACLFAFQMSAVDGHPYQRLLTELWNHPRKSSAKTLEFSFVSKLVAFHDESWPLYDIYVRNFFGIGCPSIGTNEFRIDGFTRNMTSIRHTYHEWLERTEMLAIVERAIERLPVLASCHKVRVCDFLVWQAGKNAPNQN